MDPDFDKIGTEVDFQFRGRKIYVHTEVNIPAINFSVRNELNFVEFHIQTEFCGICHTEFSIYTEFHLKISYRIPYEKKNSMTKIDGILYEQK